MEFRFSALGAGRLRRDADDNHDALTILNDDEAGDEERARGSKAFLAAAMLGDDNNAGSVPVGIMRKDESSSFMRSPLGAYQDGLPDPLNYSGANTTMEEDEEEELTQTQTQSVSAQPAAPHMKTFGRNPISFDSIMKNENEKNDIADNSNTNSISRPSLSTHSSSKNAGPAKTLTALDDAESDVEDVDDDILADAVPLEDEDSMALVNELNDVLFNSPASKTSKNSTPFSSPCVTTTGALGEIGEKSDAIQQQTQLDSDSDDDILVDAATQSQIAALDDEIDNEDALEAATQGDDLDVEDDIAIPKPVSTNMDIGEEDDYVRDSDGEDAPGTSTKKLTNLKKNDSAPKSSVQEELDAIERIEQGPSAEQIARDKLVSLNRDEMEITAEILLDAGKSIVAVNDQAEGEQRTKLKEVKQWLNRYYSSKNEDTKLKVSEPLERLIERYPQHQLSLDKVSTFLRKSEEDSDSDVWASEFEGQDEETSSDSDSEDELELVDEEGDAVNDHKEADTQEEDLASTTDQLDLNDNNFTLGQYSQTQSSAPVSNQAIRSTAHEQQEFYSLKSMRKQRLNRMTSSFQQSMSPQRGHRSHTNNANSGIKSKKNLIDELRGKVANTATQSYCRVAKIDEANLALSKQIQEHCATFLSLLAEREERKKQIEKRKADRRRYENRRMLEATADDSDEEFDVDNFTDGAQGGRDKIELSEEQQAAMIREMAEEGEELEEEAAEMAEDEADAALAMNEQQNEENEDTENVESRTQIVEDMEMKTQTQTQMQESSHLTSQQTLVDDSQLPMSAMAGVSQTQVDSMDADHSVSSPSAAIPTSTDGTDEAVVDSPESAAAQIAAALAKKKKSGKTAFQLQVEEEERRARAEKSNKSGLFDAEAEEEEEEGRQAGLGDFGFGGVTSREADDEREALKVRKDDFKNIVDQLDDDEAANMDEDAAARFRQEQEEARDKEMAKDIIRGVTLGRNAGKRAKGQMDESLFLKDSEDQNADEDAEGEAEGTGNEELDLEEAIQRGFAIRRDMERRYAPDSSDDEDEDGSDDEMNEEGDGTMDNSAEKERRRLAKELQKMKRREFKKKVKEKQVLRQEQINKAKNLRRSQSMSQSQSQSQGMTMGNDSQPGPPPLLRRQSSMGSSNGLPPSSNAPPLLRRANSSYSSGDNRENVDNISPRGSGNALIRKESSSARLTSSYSGALLDSQTGFGYGLISRSDSTTGGDNRNVLKRSDSVRTGSRSFMGKRQKVSGLSARSGTTHSFHRSLSTAGNNAQSAGTATEAPGRAPTLNRSKSLLGSLTR